MARLLRACNGLLPLVSPASLTHCKGYYQDRPGDRRTFPQNVGQPGLDSTAPRNFAACTERQLCHNFVAKNMRELSHVD
jgi:hypothetical protein